MGEANQKKRRFLELHPVCAFCGGGVAAVSEEHCPPKSMFRGRNWPQGFNWPACKSCNGGTSNDDLLLALIARASAEDPDRSLPGLLKLANRQFPGLTSRMLPSAIEARKLNRRIGTLPAPGQTHQEVSAIKIPPEAKAAVRKVCAKLGKAIYYKETGRVFPNDGCIILQWETRSRRDSEFFTAKALADIPAVFIETKRSGKFLDDQFQIKVSATNEGAYLSVQVQFSQSICALIVLSPIPGKLEATVLDIEKRKGPKHSYGVLQSAVPAQSEAGPLIPLATA